ncbi:MAG: inositol 2-dehydrogenase [Calditrichaeota bacterium]|nr:MAG: inositol 2-dehydrogenase [Calditrichota bacterium]
MKIGVGVVGAGRIGKLHAENLAYRIPEARLLAISDVILDAARETAARLEIPKAVPDYHALLEDPDIHAVVICSSTDTHAQIIQDAARAGKHIFCEKPIDLDLQRVKQALETVESSGVKFQVGFNRRFDANFRRVREAIAGGEIGEPHILRITSRDPAPPPLAYVRVSGGIFLDMTIHDFDMARFLIGSDVAEVYAVGDVFVDPAFKEAGDVDTAIVHLTFENGVLGTIDNSRQAVYGYDQRVEVFGSKGMVQAHNNTPDNVVTLDQQAVRSAKPLYFFLERYREAYVAEMQAFIDCIRDDTPPPVTGEDGLIPLQLGLAAQRSLAEHRPVRLTEISSEKNTPEA